MLHMQALLKTAFLPNEVFVFFDRETKSKFLNQLKTNIPSMNMEVWETSILSKPVLFQGVTANN